MTTTQTPAQDVSDADLGAALREFRRHFPLQASAAWHYATERAKDMNVARELQQPLAAPVDASANEWKQAVINELVTAHILTIEHETNPRKAIQDAITWNCQVALDPAVSSDARALVERGLQQAQLDGCTESNCQRCTTAPYARGDMKHAGIGSYPNATPQSSAPVVGDDRAPIAEGGGGQLGTIRTRRWHGMRFALRWT